MTESEALRILRDHNIWRRYSPDDPFAPPSPNDPVMADPKQLGIAIDVACRALAEHETAMQTLRQIAADTRRTKAQRLAWSYLVLLESMRDENAKRGES